MTQLPQKMKHFILRYTNSISQHELPLLRGAINQVIKDNSSILFHNHEGEKFRYSYPLIQYKRINNQAALVCINEGTEAVGLLLNHGDFACRLGDRTIEMEIQGVKAGQTLIQAWDSTFHYYLRKWLPLNQDNYEEYQQLEGIAEKCSFLERILVGNILSMGKGLGVKFEREITCKIIHLSDPRLMKLKNVKMMAYDAEFKCNVSLPDYFGLGKGASLGFGMVVGKKVEKI
jgi:hypothetical protein